MQCWPTRCAAAHCPTMGCAASQKTSGANSVSTGGQEPRRSSDARRHCEGDPRRILLSVCAWELPMKAFLLLVTWLALNQPPSHYQVQFSSNETCEAARQQLIKDAERIRQT